MHCRSNSISDVVNNEIGFLGIAVKYCGFERIPCHSANNKPKTIVRCNCDRGYARDSLL
jgi:hypothetical protein